MALGLLVALPPDLTPPEEYGALPNVHSNDVYQHEGDAHGARRLFRMNCGNVPNQQEGDEKRAQAGERKAVLAREFGVGREML